MATVTYGSGSLAPALGAVGDSFSGRIEGEKFNEGRRQFNEGMRLERDKFDEQKLQWSEDMEFRYGQLKQLALDNRLDRSQRDRFAQMEDLRAREMQRAGFDFQEYFTRNVEQPWQAGQNEADRAVQRRGQDLVYRADTYRTTKNFQSEMSRLEEEKRQHSDYAGTAVRIGTEILGGADWNSFTPEQQQAALARAVEMDLGTGRVNGTEGVVQATPQELAASQDKMRDVLANLGTRKQEFFDTQSKLAALESQTRNGMMVASTGGSGKMAYAVPDATWESAGFGVPPRDHNHMSGNDVDLDAQILGLMADIHDQAVQGGFDQYGMEVLKTQYAPQLQALIMQMDHKDPTVLSYYDTMFQATLYPDGVGAESLSIE